MEINHDPFCLIISEAVSHTDPSLVLGGREPTHSVSLCSPPAMCCIKMAFEAKVCSEGTMVKAALNEGNLYLGDSEL